MSWREPLGHERGMIVKGYQGLVAAPANVMAHSYASWPPLASVNRAAPRRRRKINAQTTEIY
jgi:hypothetical protein